MFEIMVLTDDIFMTYLMSKTAYFRLVCMLGGFRSETDGLLNGTKNRPAITFGFESQNWSKTLGPPLPVFSVYFGVIITIEV